MIQKLSPAAVVSFHFLKPVVLQHRLRLKPFLADIVRKEAKSVAHLSFVFCSDPYLLAMNRKFLHHDFYTDILTFPLDGGTGVLHGEMYLSIDRIRDNARTLSVRPETELHRVMFHGVLHLCGFDDKTLRQQTAIRAKEDFYLRRYFQG